MFFRYVCFECGIFLFHLKMWIFTFTRPVASACQTYQICSLESLRTPWILLARVRWWGSPSGCSGHLWRGTTSFLGSSPQSIWCSNWNSDAHNVASRIFRMDMGRIYCRLRGENMGRKDKVCNPRNNFAWFISCTYGSFVAKGQSLEQIFCHFWA